MNYLLPTFEKRLTILLEEPNLSRSCDRNQLSIPKTQRVQPYLLEREEFQKNCLPKLLSIGPIHHGKPNLELGEHYKKRWTKAYLEDLNPGEPETKAAAQRLHQKIASNIEDFKKRWYSEDAIKEYKGKNDDLVWMLFVDGCSILHVMNKADKWEIADEDVLEMKIADEDVLEMKIDQRALLLQDMLLLENQLPYELLLLLMGDEHKTTQSMLKLLQKHQMTGGTEITNYNGPRPAHLLDLLHKILVKKPSTPRTNPCRGKQINSYKIRNIRELKAAGISVNRSQKASIEDVNFKSNWYKFWAPRYLELPEIIVDNFTAPTFMNLIAYEMSPDFLNNFGISSYVAFLDLLIDHAEDVKELRSAGVLRHHLGNDEEVATLFNTMSTDLIADMTKYALVRGQIEEHCNKQRNIQWAEFISAYFSSPWTCVALIAGIILFFLTVVQTWFTIYPLMEFTNKNHMSYVLLL